MSDLKLVSIQPWAPHLKAAPVTHREAHGPLTIAANGTRTCSGGWQLNYAGVQPGQAYRIHVEVEQEDIEVVRDVLQCIVHWGEISPTQANMNALWENLLPEKTGERSVRFSRTLTAPAGADRLTIRCTFRWSAQGKSVWSVPQIHPTPTPAPPRPVKIAVVTGHAHARRGPFQTVQDNIDFYAPLCETACGINPDLIVLPEVALQWELPDNVLDLAVPAPGPETDVFAEIACRHHARICLGMFERDGDAVYNSAILISPEGIIDGKYRKVHLAVGGESESGILPGDGFPVFDTEIGRIGCNICMDSSAAESSRMVGLNGADFLLLPIMGDHRASRWSPGAPIFNESRWEAIMRTRAMDNQLCMVVARNRVQGSCIINRKGDILAWNEGDEDVIQATVTLEDGYRTWNGGCFRDVNWMQRRPHLYHAFVDQDNKGSLR